MIIRPFSRTTSLWKSLTADDDEKMKRELHSLLDAFSKPEIAAARVYDLAGVLIELEAGMFHRENQREKLLAIAAAHKHVHPGGARKCVAVLLEIIPRSHQEEYIKEALEKVKLVDQTKTDLYENVRNDLEEAHARLFLSD